VALLDLGVGARYCAKLIRKETFPRIATWLIFEIGVLMSLAAYFASNDHSFVKDALNITDAIVVTAILASLFIEQRGVKIQFTWNEQLCLVISSITVAAWALTRTPWIGFAGFQVVMSVAYFPTIESVCTHRSGRRRNRNSRLPRHALSPPSVCPLYDHRRAGRSLGAEKQDAPHAGPMISSLSVRLRETPIAS
jgi:hypothetical protein